MADAIEFEGVIQSAPGGGACVPVPFDPNEVFGTRKSVRVQATYDGFAAASNVVTMDGRAVLGVHKATREAIGKHVGDAVRIKLVRDVTPRTVEIPMELEQQFGLHANARPLFDALAYTYRKEFANWVAVAKKDVTRARRAAQVIEKLHKSETL